MYSMKTVVNNIALHTGHFLREDFRCFYYKQQEQCTMTDILNCDP